MPLLYHLCHHHFLTEDVRDIVTNGHINKNTKRSYNNVIEIHAVIYHNNRLFMTIIFLKNDIEIASL